MFKYEIITHNIIEQIESGVLKQGDKLPSIRELTELEGVGKASIIRAYQELELMHKVYSVSKSGYYVATQAVKEISNTDCIAFDKLLPDPKLIPYKAFQHCIDQSVTLYKSDLFVYGDRQGLPSLRMCLTEHFRTRFIYTTEDQIVVTSGSQQALSILASMKFPNSGDTVLIEQPSYEVFQDMLITMGYKVVGIERNLSGINLKKLEEVFKTEKIKFFYTIPKCHNPLGTNLSEHEKKKIVALAKKYNVYIVEDDYLSDLIHSPKMLPMKYYDEDNKVIYLKSFSKAFMPGIRIGAVALPPQLVEEFCKIKKFSDLSTSILNQSALDLFIRSGMYDKHTSKARKCYGKKIKLAKSILKDISNDLININIQDQNMIFWIDLKNDKIRDQIITRLDKSKIEVKSSKSFSYIVPNPVSGIRICLSYCDESILANGLQLLRDIIIESSSHYK